jgi:hypothetical protein
MAASFAAYALEVVGRFEVVPGRLLNATSGAGKGSMRSLLGGGCCEKESWGGSYCWRCPG